MPLFIPSHLTPLVYIYMKPYEVITQTFAFTTKYISFLYTLTMQQVEIFVKLLLKKWKLYSQKRCISENMENISLLGLINSYCM